MKLTRILALVLCLTMALSLAACGKKAQPAKTADELMNEENQILSAHQELWDKVFLSMDKNVTESVLSTNYGDFLAAALENVKTQFSDKDYAALKEDAAKIRDIEEQISSLPQDDSGTAASTAEAFPQFQGKTLDGEDVDSSLFANNAFTVINFWFNECKPCVAELGELDALNKKVAEQGGEVIGINVGTLDGNQEGIENAKKLLEAKGATYRCVYFDSSSEAGTFALNIQAFPTTIVVDRNGNLVGAPVLGGIDNESNMAMLQANIDQALAG